MEDLTFHIIYMPQTVRYLTPLVMSLLRWSNCSFRLVTNGCDSAEQETLAEFCHGNPRLEFSSLPSPTPIPHGRALTYLQEINRERTFCFMDSDIFATGPFLTPFSERFDQDTALFSCTPLWCTPQESIMPNDYPRIYGRHSRTADGVCLGSTYFAIYHNQALANVRKTTQIDFIAMHWPQIPTDCQAMLKSMSMVKTMYDTGKLLNLYLHHQGHKLHFCDVPGLHHLGGFSRYSLNSSRTVLEHLVTAGRLFYRRDWQRLLVKLPYWIRYERWHLLRERLTNSILARQVSTERYLSELIIAAVDQNSPPSWTPIVDDQVGERITDVASALMNLYAGVARAACVSGGLVNN